MAGDRFDPNEAARLLDPERKRLIDPDSIVAKLDIQKKMNIIDLGSGNGLFTIPLAEKTTGDVYAVDVEPEMLGILSARVEEYGLENVGYVQADLEEVSLGDAVADRVVIAFVMHEVEDRLKAFEEVNRMLTKGAKGAVVEWAKVADPQEGPPADHRIDAESVTEELKKAGLQVDEVDHGKEIYTVYFHKRA